MKKVVVVALCGLWPVLVAAEQTKEHLAAQVSAIEIQADEIEMVKPMEFHAKGNVVITGRGDEIRTNKAVITEKEHLVIIETEEDYYINE
ncbi:hypothetical protein ACLPHM_05060 [Paenalcaligenes sp. Me131]|uniref:hypothetical protein n=1 Tax=Paenalcaligenes sp. Me131 TaxID=3392636 RepID=UPI003D291EE5